jgi:hypothetical protein
MSNSPDRLSTEPRPALKRPPLRRILKGIGQLCLGLVLSFVFLAAVDGAPWAIQIANSLATALAIATGAALLYLILLIIHILRSP